MNPWVIAARPATLWASVAPVLVGSGLALGSGAFRFDVFAVTMVTAVLLNVAVNFANDASDAGRGADTPDRIGPPRAVASGLLTARRVWAGTAVVLAAAIGGGVYLTVVAGWVVIAIGSASIAAALAYTAGPAYGYRGLGEVFVFAFFGLAATVGSRYVHDGTAPAAAWLLAVPVGMLVTAILVANNVRDLDTDARAGKRTLAVRLGRDRTRLLFAGCVWGAFVLIAAFAALACTPRLTAIALVAAPAARRPVGAVFTHVSGPPLITALKATARLHAVVGALVGLGASI